MIQELKLEIAKLRRDKYGISSERRARLIDQLELQLEELEATATEDALAAEQAVAETDTTVHAFTRRKPMFAQSVVRQRSSSFETGSRGIAFGFVSSHRDRKSSKPDHKRDERAKKFSLCSPSRLSDFQTRLP